MDLSKPASMAGLARRMVEESERRADKLAALREAIAAGSYSASAASIAEAVMRSMQG
jgi:anti-sigma28 factor (negative regulator of flagellin synthesis)